MIGNDEGGGECSPYRISNDDNDNIVVVPRQSASLHATSPNGTQSRSPIASFVALGTRCARRFRLWALVVIWQSLGASWSFSSLLVVALVRLVLVCWGMAVVCRSLSSLPAFFELLGCWRRFGRTALFVVV